MQAVRIFQLLGPEVEGRVGVGERGGAEVHQSLVAAAFVVGAEFVVGAAVASAVEVVLEPELAMLE